MKMKKIIMVLLAGLLTSALVLTGCDNDLKSGIYSTTAEKMGITIPAAGITLDEWCQSEEVMTYVQMLEASYIPGPLYKDGALKNPFSGSDRLYANTPIYSEFNLMGDGPKEPPIGEISGTIILTDVPSPAPRVSILVSGDISSKWWCSSNRINLRSGNYTNLSWSIPIYEHNGFYPSNGDFTLYIQPTGSTDKFWVDIPIESYIGSVNANGINLGTVSIKSITLSGTLNITHNGQLVQPDVRINARTTDGQLIGGTSLDSFECYL